MSCDRADSQRLSIVYFDAVGTLFYLPQSVGYHYAEVAGRHGWELEGERLEGAFRRAWGAMEPRVKGVGAYPDDDKGWWFILVMRVLEECDFTAGLSARSAYFEELYGEFALPTVWSLYPEVRVTLEALRPKVRLGIISNFDGRLRTLLGHFGILDYFSPIVISSEIGADKPDRRIFEEALRRSGVGAGGALHVGDDPERDWRGAAAAGLQVFELDRPRNSLSDLLFRLGD